jgi:hypothetical protein
VGKVNATGEVKATRKTKAAGKPNAPKGARRVSVSRKKPKSTSKTAKVQKQRTGRAVKATSSPKHRRIAPPVPAPSTFRVRALDPLAMCGAETSVRQLYRVDEAAEGVLRAHLVFFDRHGWYCEHGRTCPAVVHARKVAEKIHRTTGPTHNGRMRA